MNKCLKKYFFISLDTVMGVQNIDEKVVKEEYYKAFSNAEVLLIKRARNPLYYPDFIYELTPSCKELKENVKVLHMLSSWVSFDFTLLSFSLGQ